MLMQRYGLTADKAFAVLRRISQNNNVKIGALAEELVGTGSIRIVDLTLND
jgi:AmiR/NasT family two-component response regulator